MKIVGKVYVFWTITGLLALAWTVIFLVMAIKESR